MADLPKLSGAGVSFVHLNTQSIFSKIEELRLIAYDTQPDVLCISESWLNQKTPDGFININGYYANRLDRQTGKRGGGLVTYFRNNVFEGVSGKYSVLCTSNEDIELQVFELKVRNIQKMIIMNVYRPPSGKVDSFIDTLSSTLQAVEKLHEFDVFILGDCNLAYNQTNNPSYRKLKQLEIRFGLRQIITDPTRINSSVANILDLIFTNSTYISDCGTWEINISDHQPVYAIRKKERTKQPKVVIECRSFKNYIKSDFQQDLQEHNWDNFFLLENPEDAWCFLYETILYYANRHCPYTKFTAKNSQPEWINQEVLEQLKERDRVYRMAKRSDSIELWNQVKKLRNYCNNLIRKAKNEYVILQLEESSGDSKKFWRVINSTFTPSSSQSQCTISLCDPVTKLPVPHNDCPNYMNEFLVAAGPKLACAIPNIPFIATFNRFMTRLKLTRITVEETVKVIDQICISKSSAVAKLTSRVLKDAFLAIPIHLNFVYNLSIDTGIFPESWKKGNVVLIPKEGSRSDPNNYRPISLLPLPGKMLEKLIHSRLYTFLESNHILTTKQGGFRPGFSTTLTATSLITDILEAHNVGSLTAAVFVDLRKAFDTIDHVILLRKLHDYGICNSALHWFESYLTHRQQRTMVNGIFSDFQFITHGVPQGSVLGPVLFLLYINDVTQVINQNLIHLYADDTVLYMPGNNSLLVQTQLQACLDTFVKWCKMNKLTINTKKTKSLTFFHNPNQGSECSFTVDGQRLESVTSYKYLGYVLDKNLNYNLMMTQLVNKMNYKIYLLAKLRPLLTKQAALAVYKSMILSYLDYNLLFYSSAKKSFQNKFQVIQNKAIRIICKLPSRLNVDEHHVKLNIPHVYNRHWYFLMKYMHALSTHPSTTTLDIRDLPTRLHRGRPFKLPSRSSIQYMKSFIYVGRTLWNQLSPESQMIPTLEQFNAFLKYEIKVREKDLYQTNV